MQPLLAGSFSRHALYALLIGLCASTASLADTKYSDEYLQRVTAAKTVSPLDNNLFGDSINDYSGGVQFSQTDVSLPGNFGLSVGVARRYAIADKTGLSAAQKVGGLFGDWDLDLPHMEGVYGPQGHQAMTLAGANVRCDVTSWDQARPPFVDYFQAEEYWHGNHLYLPGQGAEEVLHFESGDKPTDPLNYRWVTKGRWYFSCTPASNVSGDAFLARAPDGSKYWFTQIVQRSTAGLTKPYFNMSPKQGDAKVGGPTPQLAPGGMVGISRKDVWALPTRVEDRFGNWVTYAYDPDNPWRLLTIESSDGRQITLTYNAAGKVATVFDESRTWTYTYNASSGYLTAVTLPDASQWTFDLSQLNASHLPPSSDTTSCGDPGGIYGAEYFGTMTHPAGTQGKFTVKNRWLGRAYVMRSCQDFHDPNNYGTIVHTQDQYPVFFSSPSLLRKELSGPGMATQQWAWTYPTLAFSYADQCAGTPCVDTRVVSVLQPDGSTQRQTYGTHFGVNEGLLLKSETVASTGAVLSTRTTDYATDQTGQEFPYSIGGSGQEFAEPDTGRQKPVVRTQTLQQAATFTWQVDQTSPGIYAFDSYANPLKITRSSSGLTGPQPGYSRTEQIAYVHDADKWVLSQVGSVTCSGGPDCTPAKEMSRTEYDATSLLPWKTYSFGVLQQTLTYDLTTLGAKGALSTITDGRGNVTTIPAGNWYRGIPGRINFPTGHFVSAAISQIGTIASVTNEVTAKTCYGYDAMGRLNLVTYPSEAVNDTCNTTTWANTTRSFVKVATAEYGIAAGHWKQTLQTGNGKTTTFYDAQWRPVLTLTEDAGNALSKSFVVTRYDAAGRAVFASYPVGTLTSVNDVLKGVTTSYDALGRVTQVQQDAEATQPILTTTTTYLSGFRTQVTNPRGFQTVTNYQAFDSPSTDAPLEISLPEGAWTTMVRDVFGKPKYISRSGIYAGNVLGVTRWYVYDANERLCKTINPESGATLVDYDLAGNVVWSADGTALTGSLICDRGSVAEGERTNRTYDALNRVTAVDTPGGTADVDTTYYADGKVHTLIAANPGTNNVTTAYTYNNRRLLTRETIQVNALTPWGFDYAYNANGHLSSQTYPGALLVGYAPDALGRPTQAGTFASNVTYYPNGAISGFTYGNGIVHTMTQNARRLPARSLDAFGAAKVLDDTYTYDANGNVLSMADAAGTGLNDRTWGVAAPTLYDGLDRLLSVRGTNWGTLTGSYNALYSYDPLDNIRSAKIGASGYTHAYDLGTPSNTNRLVSMQLNGGTTFALGTDAAGNITSDARTSHGYQFDVAHRLTGVTGPGAEGYLYDGNGRRARTLNSTTGTIEYFGYGADGRLLADWSNRRQVRNQYIYLGNTLVGLNEVSITTFAVAPRYKHTDALGSPVATTDSARNITNRTVYTPYGIPMTPVDGVGYTGHFEDLGTTLTYMQQRYYDPQIGRFLSTDPVPTDANTGATFNRYSYANNNPYKFTDPDGRFSCLKEGACEPKPETKPPPPPTPSRRERGQARERQGKIDQGWSISGSRVPSLPVGLSYTTKAHLLIAGVGEESSVTTDLSNHGAICATTATCLYLGPGLIASSGPGVTAGVGSMEKDSHYFGFGFDASFIFRAAGDFSFNSSGVSASADTGVGEGGVIYAKVCRVEASKGAGCN